jgi:hypothetical protein
MKFTKEAIDELPPPSDGRREYVAWDSDLPGFGVRVRARSKFWRVQYRAGLRQHSLSLGDVRKLDLAVARKTAREYFAQVRLGRDPAAERRAAPIKALEQRTAAKALAFLNRGTEPACYLYRHFHPSGDLLYVGISLEPLRRQDNHLKSASWRNLIHRIVIEPFATREEALAAEQFSIRTEFPKFNAVQNSRRHPNQELARLGEIAEKIR